PSGHRRRRAPRVDRTRRRVRGVSARGRHRDAPARGEPRDGGPRARLARRGGHVGRGADAPSAPWGEGDVSDPLDPPENSDPPVDPGGTPKGSFPPPPPPPEHPKSEQPAAPVS